MTQETYAGVMTQETYAGVMTQETYAGVMKLKTYASVIPHETSVGSMTQETCADAMTETFVNMLTVVIVMILETYVGAMMHLEREVTVVGDQQDHVSSLESARISLENYL